jgi:hypothetical protein
MRDPQPGVAWSRRRIMRRAAYGCWMTSEQWLQVRRRWYKEWIGRYGHDPVCAVCYTPWSLSCGDLHHRSYRRLGQERFEDMVACCRGCHDRIHAVIDANPIWRRMDRALATDMIIAVLRKTTLRAEASRR